MSKEIVRNEKFAFLLFKKTDIINYLIIIKYKYCFHMSGGIYRSEKLNYYKVIIPKESAWLTIDGLLLI